MNCLIIFLHGLNTHGDDNMHFGPLKFDPMHSRLEPAFRARGFEFIAVRGHGSGSPEEMAEKAVAFLRPLGIVDDKRIVHFLGQSAGGLVARVLANRQEFHDRTGCVITMGTPHGGASAATIGIQFREKRPVLQRLFALMGYDTMKRVGKFRHFTTDAMSEFNRRFPDCDAQRSISMICETGPGEMGFLLAFARLCTQQKTPGDGLIESESQRWGEAIGPFRLDHQAQLGFFFHLSRQSRRRSAAEFERMVDTICDMMRACVKFHVSS